jgi:hypothetical protein
VSSRTCPDWPELMEIAPELQFKHYSVAELRLPAEVVAQIPDVPLDTLAVCADAEHHVFHAGHTEPSVAAALAGSHWFELREWVARGPGAAAM